MMMNEVAKTAVAVLLGVLVLPLITGRAQERNDETCALPQSIKVDAFESLPLAAQLARLERLIPPMEAHTNSHGFIVAYAGRLSTLAAAQKRADQTKRQLLEKHQWINQSDVLNARLNTLVCGYRENATMELWVTPVGAAPPVCAATAGIPSPSPKFQPLRRR